MAVVDTMSPTAVVVRVNGAAITKGDYEAYERLVTKLWALGQGYSAEVLNKETREYKARRRMAVLAEMIKNKIIEQYATKQGIEPAPERLKAREGFMLKALKAGKDGMKALEEKLGPVDGAGCRRYVWMAGLIDSVLQKNTTNQIFVVTDEHVANYRKYVENYNKNMTEKNNANMALAKKAKAELEARIARAVQAPQVDNVAKIKAIKKDLQAEAGTNRITKAQIRNALLENTNTVFAVVAQQYSQTNQWEGVSWQDVEVDEFDAEDPLLQWLLQAKVGDITEPMILDDGLSIVGLKRKSEIAVAEEGMPKRYEYELVRCYFYYYDKLPEYSKREDIVEEITNARWSEVMSELREKLTKDSVIEFPSGRNLFYPRRRPGARKEARVHAAGTRANARRGRRGKRPQAGAQGVKKSTTK